MAGTMDTSYARTPEGLAIAYRVVGEGPTDIILFVPGFAIDCVYEDRVFASVQRRLSGLGRFIYFDWRGFGSSDPIPGDGLPTPEEWMDDARVVLDAVGSSRAIVVASTAIGAMGLLFAATHSDRTEALVLVDTYARAAEAPDYPTGFPQEVLDSFIDHLVDRWGTGDAASFDVPSRASDPEFVAWYGRLQRLTVPLGNSRRFWQWNLALDARAALSSVRVPTLVLHHEAHLVVPADRGRYLAEHIEGAQLVELPGMGENWQFSERCSIAVLDEIEKLVTGASPVRDVDRVLATVLFTDIVDSTARAQAAGDARWRQLLDEHDTIAGRAIERFRGRLIKSTGDGVLATFDGPARAVRCAHEIAAEVRGLGLEVRAGVHTGEVEVRGDDIGGIAVHIGARIAALAGAGEVLTSGTVRDLVAGSGLVFADRGVHALKGVAEPWGLFAASP